MALRSAPTASLLSQLRAVLLTLPTVAGTTRSISSDAASDSRHAPVASSSSTPKIPSDGLTLQHFVQLGQLGREPAAAAAAAAPALSAAPPLGRALLKPSLNQTDTLLSLKKKVFIETYGCQMNVNDSEVVLSVLATAGYRQAASADGADVVLVNTCAIRENAEAKVGGEGGVGGSPVTKPYSPSDL